MCHVVSVSVEILENLGTKRFRNLRQGKFSCLIASYHDDKTLKRPVVPCNQRNRLVRAGGRLHATSSLPVCDVKLGRFQDQAAAALAMAAAARYRAGQLLLRPFLSRTCGPVLQQFCRGRFKLLTVGERRARSTATYTPRLADWPWGLVCSVSVSIVSAVNLWSESLSLCGPLW